MNRLLFKAITPGELPEAAAMLAAGIGIGGILISDYLAPHTISLRILYLFPLALLSIHVTNRRHLFIGQAAVIIGLADSIYQIPLPLSSRHVQFALSGASFFFVAYLIRVGRRRYLEIQRLATHDELTGLKNRQAFQLALEAEIARLDRYATVFSLAVIDLDGFKRLNDEKGHDQGDEALRLVSRTMSGATRRTDTVARIGGDEFALLMPNTGRPECERTCLMLVDRVAEAMLAAGYGVTASIGAAAFVKTPESAATAMKIADKAMYEAKAQGKARACFAA